MRSRVLVTSLLALPVLALAGCGGDDDEERSAGGTTTATATEPQPTTSVPETSPVVLALYFARDGKLGFTQRATTSRPQVGTAALNELLKGPTAADRTAGLTTDIPSGTSLERLTIEDGVAKVELSKPLGEVATAQVVFTLTSFPTVRRVELEGEQHVRSDFEEVTPAVLVESPAPGEQVTSPMRIAGTANTFEATFQVQVLGAGGRVLGQRFVTATSGSGTRGTFDTAVTFAAQPGPATLVVYELSAEDGSRINEVEIPLEIKAS